VNAEGLARSAIGVKVLEALLGPPVERVQVAPLLVE
jgi:hypothetical protein